MTIQERPIGEQTELQDSLPTNGVGAQEPFVEQSQPVADEPTPAEQTEDAAAAVAEQTAPVAVAQTESHADAPGDAEPSATPESDTTGAQDAVSGQTAPASDATTLTTAEVEGPVTSEPTTEATAVETEAIAPVASVTAPIDETPTAEAAPAPSDTSDAPAETTAAPIDETPTAEAAPAPSDTSDAPAETTADAGAEGASYTPPAEDASRPRRVKDLQPGMELEGRVTSIALYGIFVDLGVGRDGLVHISEMSDQRIDSPSDVVQIGDAVKVRVKSVEPDGRRISLTMRSPERAERRERGERGGRKKPELNRERLASLRVGDTVDGTVTGIAPFGVFVDIGVGKDGLVHISELAEGRIEKAEDAVQVGQSYPFKLLEVDADGTRISLSLRRAQRTQRMQQLDKGQIVEGVVSGIAPFGAFVDIGVGRDGLVHISELAENRVNRVEDVVKVGDKVQVRVLEADTGSKRISLSMLLEDRPQEEAEPRRDFSSTPREGSPARDFSAPREGGPPRQERSRRDFSMPPRESTPRRDDRSSRGSRGSSNSNELTQYSTPTPAEPEFEGDNATLEDLLSKYGSAGRRDNKRRRHEDEEEPTTEDRGSTRRQRDAIRRTIQHMDEE